MDSHQWVDGEINASAFKFFLRKVENSNNLGFLLSLL